jgi:hypothetical protein
MVRKSVRKLSEHDDRDLKRALTQLPSFQKAAADVLADAGVQAGDPVTVMVETEEYEACLAVELIQARISEDDPKKRDRRVAAELVETFGREIAAVTIKAYRGVQKRLEQASEATGRPAVAVPLTSQARRDADVLGAIEKAFTDRPVPQMTVAQIAYYSAQRARELGFAPAAVWAKQQGRRSADHNALKRARAQIVLELSERNANLADIGAIFGGRRKESVFDLEQLGRKQREEAQHG